MDIRDYYKPIHFTHEIHVELKYFKDELEHNNANLSPSYQRGSVWTLEQKENFMGHLLSGGEVAPLIFQRVPDFADSEVLDGKQRTEAILGWLNNEFGARLLFDNKMIFYKDITPVF